MQAVIGKRQAKGDYGFEAFAIVKGVFRLEPDIDWKGKKWPVYAIVREEVTPIYSLIGDFSWFEKDPKPVEGIYPPVTRTIAHTGIRALHTYKDLSAKWHEYTEKMRKAKKPSQIAAGERLLEHTEREMLSSLNYISNAFPPLAEIMGILQGEGTPLRDVHGNNVGVRTHPGVVDPQDPESGLGYVICFDPGHTPSSEEIAAEERGIARLNTGAMPEGFDDLFDDVPVAPRSAADDLLSRVKRDDIVKIKNTKWLVFRAFGVGASNAWVYKYPSKKQKMYTLYRVGNERFAVYEVNGMNERVSEDLVEGPAEIISA
jgi:hypothetical protein